MQKKRPPWTNRYKANWDEAYENMMAWWAGDSISRPVVLNSIPKVDTASFRPERDPGTKMAQDLDAEYQFEKIRHEVISNIYNAEAVPAVKTGFGNSISMLPSMAGADLNYNDDGQVWVGKIPDIYERELPVFNKEHKPYKLTIALMHKHAAYYGYDCILGSDAMMDPLTIFSMMRGVEELCMDIIDRPEDVDRWLERLSDIRYKMALVHLNGNS